MPKKRPLTSSAAIFLLKYLRASEDNLFKFEDHLGSHFKKDEPLCVETAELASAIKQFRLKVEAQFKGTET